MHVKKTFYHLGIDETTLGVGSGNLITVLAQTQNENLIDFSYNAYKKAKNYILENPSGVVFPSLTRMREQGLEKFHWVRVHGGRYKPRELQHASIARVVRVNGYRPDNVVLHVDAFESRHDRTRFIIKELLKRNDFPIHEKQILVWGSGDRSVPIINFADLLAAQIGLDLYETYQQYGMRKPRFQYKKCEVDFKKERTLSITPQDRALFSLVLESYKPVGLKNKRRLKS